jgi:hypothetical protein
VPWVSWWIIIEMKSFIDLISQSSWKFLPWMNFHLRSAFIIHVFLLPCRLLKLANEEFDCLSRSDYLQIRASQPYVLVREVTKEVFHFFIVYA